MDNMWIKRFVDLFDLQLLWKDGCCSAYTNDCICICLYEVNASRVVIKIDYIKTFTRWANSFYHKIFNVTDEVMLNLLESDIKKIMSLEKNSVVKSLGSLDYSLDMNFLYLEGVLDNNVKY